LLEEDCLLREAAAFCQTVSVHGLPDQSICTYRGLLKKGIFMEQVKELETMEKNTRSVFKRRCRVRTPQRAFDPRP
jgi:hypothetical protein